MKAKRIIALLLAVIMVVSLAGCGGEKATTEDLAKEVAQISDQLDNLIKVIEANGGVSSTGGTDSGDVVVDDTTGEDTSSEETTAEGETTKPGSTSSNKTTTKKTDNTPKTTAEILALYNKATKLVSTSKPGYTKHRASTLNDYEAGIALTAFKSVVLKFMGVGAENEYKATVTKGKVLGTESGGGETKFAPLSASKLTEGDLKKATCTKNGNNYIVTLEVKDGSSYIAGGSGAKNNSPIDKTGICVSNSDRSEFDHKIAEGIYDAIQDTAGSTVVDEKTSACKVVATIDAASSKISKVVVTFTANVSLDKCLGSKGVINGTTTVTYSDFKW